eukprot:7430094-Ditylum_brightwellii.AAC.1
MMIVQVARAKQRSLLVQVGRAEKTRTRMICQEVPVQVYCLLWKPTAIVTLSKTETDESTPLSMETAETP